MILIKLQLMQMHLDCIRSIHFVELDKTVIEFVLNWILHLNRGTDVDVLQGISCVTQLN